MPKTSAFNPAQGGSDMRAMIAERAYYKAEQRGFVPGYEVADWLEAEREFSGAAMTEADPKPKKRRKTEKNAVKKKKVSAKN